MTSEGAMTLFIVFDAYRYSACQDIVNDVTKYVTHRIIITNG